MDTKLSKDPGPGSYSPDDKPGKHSAPKFGFGTEKKNHSLSKNGGPSPNSYKVNDSIARRTFSSWGMGYGQKIDLSKSMTETPGPGSYVYKCSLISYRIIQVISQTERSMG